MSSSQRVNPVTQDNGDRRPRWRESLPQGSIELVSISTIMHVEMWQT
jgi:hypothetical protein